MKVNKHFLSKIIRSEIKRVLYEEVDPTAADRIAQMQDVANGANEDLERKLIGMFIGYRNYLTKYPTKNRKVLLHVDKSIKEIDPNLTRDQVLQVLDGKIDYQLFNFIQNLMKQDKNTVQYSDKLDNYEMSVSPTGHDEQNRDPDPSFMRVPKSDDAYDQEDPRKDRKTYTQSQEE